jgi:hypothetical protein
MSHLVQIVQAPAVPLAVVRRRASSRELSRVVPAACGEVWTFILAHGGEGAGRHVGLSRLRDQSRGRRGGPRRVCERREVVPSATPAGPVATTAHIGPYDHLGDAHGAIRAWCKAHDHALAGPNCAIYAHWTDDPTQQRTDVFYLLERVGEQATMNP